MHLGIPEYAYKGERMKDSAYAGTVIALTQTGKVYAWGNNMYGKVGIGAGVLRLVFFRNWELFLQFGDKSGITCQLLGPLLVFDEDESLM